MEFSFKYSVKPGSLWILSMMNIYRSFTGAVNIIFSSSMILLAVRFWNETNLVIRILITAGISLFPVLQPLLILLRCRKIVRSLPQNMRIDFTGKEMIITSGKDNSHIEYGELTSVIRIKNMIIIYTRKKQSFVLSGEVLMDKGKTLYEFLTNQIK